MTGPETFCLLFVDDEGDFLATLEEFFTGLDYPVLTARHRHEALLPVQEPCPRAGALHRARPSRDGTGAWSL